MPHRIIDSAAEVAGRVLSGAAGGLAAVRPAAKPLHPDGALYHGRLVTSGVDSPTGAAWLDERGEHDVLARVSRAVGLPQALPDVFGLAVRVQLDGAASGDLLFATTGWSRVGRHLLLPRSTAARPMTTLLPYRTPTGPVVLGVQPDGPDGATFRLAWARAGRPWHPLGRIELDEGPGADPTISFDPVTNQLPGLEQYRWVVNLRERAYATARSSRS